MDAEQFLNALWGDPLPGRVLIWTLPQKRSLWLDHISELQMDPITSLDAYTGVGIARSDAALKTNQRATSDTIAGIAGLWADVDYAGDNHAKAGLPPREEDAWALIEMMPCQPTIVIHSGHGLQAWWLFDEPWMFEDDLNREEAQAMIRAWQGHMDEIAQKKGWVVDATHDLARLMRLPGTTNNKAEPVPVRVIDSDGPRHNLNIYWPWVVEREDGWVIPPMPHIAIDNLILDPDVSPPFEKFLALMGAAPKFKRSWERRRPDLADQSASSFDMSLASFAVTAGWTDQEVANLLIANRRRNGDDLKLEHTGFGGFGSYYAGTIAKVREPAAQVLAQERLEEVATSFTDNPSLAGLSEVLGVEITDLVKELGDPPAYWMGTSHGNITLGTVDNILEQGRFRRAIAAATGTVLVRIKGTDWEKRSQAILSCCRDYDLNEISDQINETCHWIDDYLDSQTILDDQSIAAQQGLPFRKGGAVYFTLGGFKNHLRFSVGEPLSSKKLGTRFRISHVLSEKVYYPTVEGRQTSRNYWTYKRA